MSAPGARSRKARVAVVFGGPSSEAEVSRVSAHAVSTALGDAGHDVTLLELGPGLPEALSRGGFEVVFPATHGTLGEDGSLQGLLEVLGLCYVGSGVLASALAANKPFAKLVLRAAGLDVPDGALLRRDGDLERDLARLVEQLGGALVIKPAGGGSALGVSRHAADASPAELVAAALCAFELDSELLVERCIFGKEVTCGVLERRPGRPVALPPTLIVARAGDFYDFRSKYASGGSEHFCPAPFSEAQNQRIQELALRAHAALGARDLSRVDFIVDDQAEPQTITLLEVNTLPGMTSTSLFPEAAAVAGLGFKELVDLLVQNALDRPRATTPRAAALPDAEPVA